MWFYNPKWLISQWSYHTHSITFLPGISTFGLGCERLILVCPLVFALNIVIKDPDFVTCNDTLEECLSWKKAFHNGSAISLIILNLSMSNLNTQLAYFSYVFQVTADSWLGFSYSIFTKVWMIILVWVCLSMTELPEQNFENQFQTWQSEITPKP